MATCVLVAAFVYLLVAQQADGCGITTHTEIGHRAASNYEYLLDNKISVAQLIKKYQAAFQAGNPYPDSFYPCVCKKGVFNYVSEDTHWVPFLNATIKYIQKKYQKPYNEEALKLIVFTLGYTSHQIADVTWHSLGVPQGFLSAMGFANFHGSFPKAHSVGDIGGDIVNQFELNMNFISDLGDWYVPYQDLYNIYFDYYGKEIVTHTDIIECSSLLFAGRLGEQVAISLLYADYYKKSPFLADKLYDYYLGGVDDMATWTQISWNKVLYMLENQVEKCKLDHSILYINCTQPSDGLSKHQNLLLDMEVSKLKHPKTREPTFYADKFDIDRSHVQVSLEGTGVSLKYSSRFQKTYGHLLRLKNQLSNQSNDYQPSSKDVNLKGPIVTSNTVYFSQRDYANLGWTLESADLNGDSFDDLVIGSPVYSSSNTYQDGAVFVILANSTTGSLPPQSEDIDYLADIVLRPPPGVTRSRFGHSVVVLDLNQDGKNDIVVSAPSFGLQDIQYEGRLYIYLGDGSMRFNQPSIIVSCQDVKYCNLGWSLSKGDINGDNIDDLIVGSPYAATCGDQCGLVAALISRQRAIPSVLDYTQFDWVLNGTMPYQWFGHSARAKLGYLAIGAPETRICYQPNCQFDDQDTQAVGSVYLYTYPNKQPTLTLKGSVEFEQFGYSFDLSKQNQKPVISISSVSSESQLDRKLGALALNRAGVVKTFDLTNTTQPKLVSVLKSDRPYAQFGSKVKYFKLNGADHEDLYISANMRTDDIALLNQIQEGIIFKFEGGPKFPTGNVTDDCGLASLIPCPSQKADLVFESSVPKSRFGFDFAFLGSTTRQSYQVAVSSIHANIFNSRLSGTVSIFSFPATKRRIS